MRFSPSLSCISTDFGFSAFVMRSILVLLFILPLALTSPAEEGPSSDQLMKQETGTWDCPTREGQVTQKYLLYSPPDWDGKSPLPMLVFLHGAGYRGDDLTKLYKDEVLVLIRKGRVFNALVACPQAPTYWSGEQAAAFLQQIVASHAGKFDPDRVYLTGESAGGGGAWEGAKRCAELLAAVVPIASTHGSRENAAKLINLPIWAFHNAHDPYQFASKSRDQVDAVREAGGKYVFYTEYTETPGKQHDGIWPNAHSHAWKTAYNYEPMWSWLFSQRRGEPERALNPMPSPLMDPKSPWTPPR
jgi:predicted peptidase